jgi:hypothetical protein
MMILWDMDDEPGGNVRHIPIDEFLTKDGVRSAVDGAVWFGFSRSSNRPMLVGPALDDRPLAVVYEMAGDDAIYPITAFYVE